MVKRYSHELRVQIAHAVFDMDRYWADLFPEGELKDLCFCDLFTQLWANSDTPHTKTELYKLMPNISPRTAVKYIQLSIELGMLEEEMSPQDRRVRFIKLTAECAARIEKFLDYTCMRFRAT